MDTPKTQTVANTVKNDITDATAKRLGDGKVVPIQRPKPKSKKK